MEAKEVNKGGRPFIYKADSEEDKERFKTQVEDYIKSITYNEPVMIVTGEVIGKVKGKPIYKEIPRLNNLGEPITKTVFVAVPSYLGLAIYLGIDKDTLRSTSKVEGYSVSYKKALAVMEEYKSSRLHTASNVAGVIFDLKNNHHWTDKQEVEITSKMKLEDFFVEE